MAFVRGNVMLTMKNLNKIMQHWLFSFIGFLFHKTVHIRFITELLDFYTPMMCCADGPISTEPVLPAEMHGKIDNYEQWVPQTEIS